MSCIIGLSIDYFDRLGLNCLMCILFFYPRRSYIICHKIGNCGRFPLDEIPYLDAIAVLKSENIDDVVLL